KGHRSRHRPRPPGHPFSPRTREPHEGSGRDRSVPWPAPGLEHGGAAGSMTAEYPAIGLIAVPGVPAIRPGDDLARILGDAVERAALTPRDGDVLVVTHKVVSKAEGRYVALAEITPSPRARELAA